MILLNTKRGSDKHSDFLEKIVENYSVVEFDQMTGEELMIHLFMRDADPQMSKLATDILRTNKATVHELRTRVKETEAAVWYNRKEYGKMANAKKESTMFCKPCNSTSHDEANYWGPCSISGRRNHKANFCKFKDNNQANTQTERADKATAKKKKKKQKKSKKQWRFQKKE